MTIYVDLLFGINSLINYLLLRGSAAMGGHPAPMGRLLAAACLGGLYAVLAVVPGWSVLQGLGLQLVTAAAMLVLAFGWRPYTLRQGLFFFGLSFAFGGAVLVVMELVEPQCLLLGGRACYGLSIPALMLLAALAYGLAAALSGFGAHTGGEIQPMELQLGEATRAIRVLRDTGNALRDPLTGQAVLVADWRLLDSLLPEPLPQALFQDPAALLQRLTAVHPGLAFRLVPYAAVGVEGGLLVAVRCRLLQGNRTVRTLAAFSPTRVSGDGSFDAIWGGEIQ